MSASEAAVDEQLGENDECLFSKIMDWEWVEKKMQASLKTNAKFGKNKSIVQIGKAQGFLSIIGRIDPDWSDRMELPQTFIIKIPVPAVYNEVASNEDMKEKFSQFITEETKEQLKSTAKNVHVTEVAFYNTVSQQGLNLRIPSCYAAVARSEQEPHAAILMSDAGKNAHIVPAYSNIAYSDLYQVLRELAILHAYSLKTEEWKDVFKISQSEIATRENFEIVMRIIKTSQILRNEKMIKLFEEIEVFDREVFDSLSAMKEICSQMSIQPVLLHGDLWPTNIMWTDENDHLKLAAIIDWQGCYGGAPVEDIMRLICCLQSGAERRHKWTIIINEYWKMIKTELGYEPPFTPYQLKKAYLKIFPLQAILALAVVCTALDFYAKYSNTLNEEMIECAHEKALALLEDIVIYYKRPETILIE